MKLTIQDLNVFDLSRQILQRLDGHYSAGGIDAGRSLNSDLLDLTIYLLPETTLSEQDLSDLGQFSESLFLEEAERRMGTKDSQLSFGELDLIDNLRLARQLLIHLNTYQLFDHVSPLHWRVMVNLATLIWPEDPERLFDRAEVMAEADNRIYYNRAYRRENLCRYYPGGMDLDRYEEYSRLMALMGQDDS